MTTPAMEERIMELMPEDAKAVLLLLARQLPYEVTKAMDRIEGRKGLRRKVRPAQPRDGFRRR